MKRLDQLTEEDLREEHDRMMGICDEEEFQGHFFNLDELGAEEMLLAKEEYEQPDRLRPAAQEAGSEKNAEVHTVGKPRDWKNSGTYADVKRRVWRQGGTNP